jgi:exodeoxyribonuclease-3
MTLRLASWNVNGIRAVHGKDLFQPFLDEVQPDIVCLQETKAQKEQSPLTLEGYHEFWHSADKAGYSGTAIFSKIKPLKVTNGLSKRIETKHGLHDNSNSPTRQRLGLVRDPLGVASASRSHGPKMAEVHNV